MRNKRKAEVLVDSGEVGGGGTLSEKHTISCRFHDFENLPHTRGVMTLSCTLKCHGHEWKIALFPGGDKNSNEDNVYVSVRLALKSEITDNLRVKYGIRAGSIQQPRPDDGVSTFRHQGDTWGYSNYVLRSDVLKPTFGFIDEEGALEIKIDIQIYTKERPIFTPKTNLHLDMLKLFESGLNADVQFCVGGEKLPANSHILKLRAPTLASLAEDAPDGSEIAILNVEPVLFRKLLRFVYGEELPSSADMKTNVRALLEATDRFGCTGLKLHVEAEVVRSVISTENAADWVLFADSHNCALLKEAAINLFASDSKAVMASSGWAAVTESNDIMKELMQALVAETGAIDESDPKTMNVSLLREKLEEKGLDVDGTREMLVKRLEAAISNE